MKNRIFSLLLFVLPILGFTQNDSDSNKASDIKTTSQKTPFQTNVMFGVRGGLNISNLDFDAAPFIVNEHRNSIYFGTFADISLSNIISLVPELQFSAEGAKDERLHLDYIQAPIFLKFKITPRVRFGVAPQIGWKVYKRNDQVKDLAFSGVTGLEYKLNEMLFVDVRYTYGITSIFHDNLGIEAKNTNIQIGVGYQF